MRWSAWRTSTTCKLDTVLDLPVRYFGQRMESDPRVETPFGKLRFVRRQSRKLVPEVYGDEMSVLPPLNALV